MNQHIKVLDKREQDGLSIKILEYQNLNGVINPDVARDLYFAQKSGMKLRQVKISLLKDDSEVVTEAGSLQYFRGNIKQENKVGGLGGLAKKMFKNKADNVDVFRPSYIGKGEVYLEPVFEHYTIIDMKDGDLLISEGMFYCASSSLKIDVQMVNVSARFLGDDGWFLTRVRGSGLLVVKIPVPESEIRIEELNNETLRVDGDLVLMFDNSLDYKVSASTKNLLRSSFSGEGWLGTYKGTGNVFLAPTYEVYRDIRSNTQ